LVGVHVSFVYPAGQVPVDDDMCTVGFDPEVRQNVIDDDEDVAPSANALPATTAPETAAATVQRCLRFKGFMPSSIRFRCDTARCSALPVSGAGRCLKPPRFNVRDLAVRTVRGETARHPHGPDTPRLAVSAAADASARHVVSTSVSGDR